MDARVNVVILPIAKRLLREDQAGRASGSGYLASTLAHEISHELGPNYSRIGNGKKDIREAIGGDFAALEEAKADAVGMFCLKWLADHNAITAEELEQDYISYVAGNFRTIRFGIAEPHGRGEMMEFNFMIEQGAVARDDATARPRKTEAVHCDGKRGAESRCRGIDSVRIPCSGCFARSRAKHALAYPVGRSGCGSGHRAFHPLGRPRGNARQTLRLSLKDRQVASIETRAEV